MSNSKGEVSHLKWNFLFFTFELVTWKWENVNLTFELVTWSDFFIFWFRVSISKLEK